MRHFGGIVIFAISFVLVGAAQADTQVAQGRDAGIGFSVGDPTGIVGKLYVGPENAIDAGISFYSVWGGHCRDRDEFRGCSGHQQISINADYLWQYNLLSGTARLDWHIGPGARVWLWSGSENADNLALAARMPVGLDFMPAKPDMLEVYLEFVPSFYVAPFAGFYLGAALGVRFYF